MEWLHIEVVCNDDPNVSIILGKLKKKKKNQGSEQSQTKNKQEKLTTTKPRVCACIHTHVYAPFLPYCRPWIICRADLRLFPSLGFKLVVWIFLGFCCYSPVPQYSKNIAS